MSIKILFCAIILCNFQASMANGPFDELVNALAGYDAALKKIVGPLVQDEVSYAHIIITAQQELAVLEGLVEQLPGANAILVNIKEKLGNPDLSDEALIDEVRQRQRTPEQRARLDALHNELDGLNGQMAEYAHPYLEKLTQLVNALDPASKNPSIERKLQKAVLASSGEFYKNFYPVFIEMVAYLTCLGNAAGISENKLKDDLNFKMPIVLAQAQMRRK